MASICARCCVFTVALCALALAHTSAATAEQALPYPHPQVRNSPSQKSGLPQLWTPSILTVALAVHTLCDSTPFLSACLLWSNCNQLAGSAVPSSRELCDPFTLVATICNIDDVGRLPGCDSYRSLCFSSTRPLKRCADDPGLTWLPTTTSVNQAVWSMCRDKQAPGCEQCTYEPGQTYPQCSLLQVYSYLCFQNPNSPHCSQWNMMCNAHSSLYLCTEQAGVFDPFPPQYAPPLDGVVEDDRAAHSNNPDERFEDSKELLLTDATAVHAVMSHRELKQSTTSTTSSCLSDPTSSACATYNYPDEQLSADLAGLCSAMPFMSSCSVAAQCKSSTNTDQVSMLPSTCSNFMLLATICNLDNMGRMAQCKNYNSLCKTASSTVQQCMDQGLAYLPTTSTANTQVKSICDEMPMDGCERCNYVAGQSYPKCNLLQVFSYLCYQMPDMGQCTDWNTMCAKDPSLYLCNDQSANFSPYPPVFKTTRTSSPTPSMTPMGTMPGMTTTTLEPAEPDHSSMASTPSSSSMNDMSHMDHMDHMGHMPTTPTPSSMTHMPMPMPSMPMTTTHNGSMSHVACAANSTNCSNHTMDQEQAQADLVSLCSAMPFMPTCSVAQLCNSTAAPAQARAVKDACSPFTLVATICRLDTGMRGMSGCKNYNSMCGPGSVVQQCKQQLGLSYLPTTNTTNTQLKSLCSSTTAPACSTCTASWTAGKTYGQCNLLQVYSNLCSQMPTMLQCAAYSAMCDADVTLCQRLNGAGLTRRKKGRPGRRLHAAP